MVRYWQTCSFLGMKYYDIIKSELKYKFICSEKAIVELPLNEDTFKWSPMITGFLDMFCAIVEHSFSTKASHIVSGIVWKLKI